MVLLSSPQGDVCGVRKEEKEKCEDFGLHHHVIKI